MDLEIFSVCFCLESLNTPHSAVYCVMTWQLLAANIFGCVLAKKTPKPLIFPFSFLWLLQITNTIGLSCNGLFVYATFQARNLSKCVSCISLKPHEWLSGYTPHQEWFSFSVSLYLSNVASSRSFKTARSLVKVITETWITQSELSIDGKEKQQDAETQDRIQACVVVFFVFFPLSIFLMFRAVQRLAADLWSMKWAVRD